MTTNCCIFTVLCQFLLTACRTHAQRSRSLDLQLRVSRGRQPRHRCLFPRPQSQRPGRAPLGPPPAQPLRAGGEKEDRPPAAIGQLRREPLCSPWRPPPIAVGRTGEKRETEVLPQPKHGDGEVRGRTLHEHHWDGLGAAAEVDFLTVSPQVGEMRRVDGSNWAAASETRILCGCRTRDLTIVI